MDKRGFTLIEVIVSISLIALVAVIFGINSKKIFGDKNKEDYKNVVVSAAETYTEANRGAVQGLYEGKGFVLLTIEQLRASGLIDDSLKDDNGNIIDDSENVLVTLNTEGYLDFTYPIKSEEVNEGYLIARDIIIAKNDNFSCDYLIGEPGGLLFNDKDGNYIKDGNLVYLNTTLVPTLNEVDNDLEYACENTGKQKVKDDITYDIYKYVYQINGVRKETTRGVSKLDDFNYSINKDSLGTGQYYLEETGEDFYTLYTSNDTFDLKIDTTYEGKPVKLVYGIKTSGGYIEYQKSNTFNNLSEGNYIVTIKVANKNKNYSYDELLNSAYEEQRKFAITKTFTLNVKKLTDLDITGVSFLDKDGKSVSNSTWNIGKKVSLTVNNEQIITSKEYKLDNASTYKTLTDELITTPASRITIRVKDKLGRSVSKTYDFKVDQMPSSPTVTSGTSTTYTPTKTFSIKLPTSTLSTSTYYYSLGNSNPNTNGTSFSSASLTVNASSLSSSLNNAKYLYLRTCNQVGCSDWTIANAYITKNISEWNDSSCTSSRGSLCTESQDLFDTIRICRSDDSNTCYYVGNKTNNYVRYGGFTWRIYKKTSGKLALIMDSSYTTTAYGQVGNCTKSCCNDGRYTYTKLGDTDRTDYFSYGFRCETMGKVLSGISLNDTNLLEYFSSGGVSVRFGLLTKYDYMRVAGCVVGSCSYRLTNYIKKDKSDFWLVDGGNSFNGDNGNYNTNVHAYVINNCVNSNGLPESITASESVYGTISTSTLSVRPIILIKSTAKITGGNGTSSSPYTLG